MSKNFTVPSVIERFREQRQRMNKLLIALLLLIVVGVTVPLVLGSIPALQNSPALKTWLLVWGSGVGILFLLMVIAAFLIQRCPVCRTPVGEELWTIHYCSHCGTKLTED